MRKGTLLVCTLLLILSCRNGNLEEQNLLEYGFPLTIDLPKGATIEEEEILLYKSLIIKKDPNFHMVLYQSDATESLAEVITDQKQLAIENPYFNEFVVDEEGGFIYRTVIDSTYTNYNFRHAKIFGQKEYLFQAGLVNQYTEKEVKDMYKIAKEAH